MNYNNSDNPTKKPTVSIIVPIRDAFDDARKCLDSIRKHCSEAELIVIDDGSKDKASQLFDDPKTWPKLCIRNEISKGWCAAINQGLKVATGDYIVLCNSDVIFRPDFIDKMLYHFTFEDIALFESGDYIPKIGILSPLTNSASSEKQQILSEEYISTIPEVDILKEPYLMFFCVMIDRRLYDEIGGLDERFGLGGQDDADYCIRARKAGWDIGIARDVFVWHSGSASFRELFGNDAPTSKIYAQSRKRILSDKYSSDMSTARRHKPPRIFIAVPNRGTNVSPLTMTLIQWVASGKYDIHLSMPEGLFPLDNARNTVVKEFLELDYDYLFWIDDDIIPPLYTIDQLLAADKDIIGAVGFSHRKDNGMWFPYPVTLRYNEDKQYILYYSDKPIDWVNATGGACILFKRQVYEQLERPYEFKYHRDGTLSLTCDFHVFQKAEALGYKVWIDFRIHCGHRKTVDLKDVQDLVANLKKEKDIYKRELEKLKDSISLVKDTVDIGV